ncbi:hypothetical protein QT987_20935 [Microcoleus sp. SVA1B4]
MPVPQRVNCLVEQAGKPVADNGACSTKSELSCGTGRKACC